jgi:hypothetical protein
MESTEQRGQQTQLDETLKTIAASDNKKDAQLPLLTVLGGDDALGTCDANGDCH